MKRLILLLVAMLMALMSEAQGMDWISMPRHVWGVRAGGRFNDMSLSYSGYGEYHHMPMIRPSFGMYTRHRLVNQLSLRTDVLYAVRGVDMNWCDVRYSIEVPYIDFRPMVQLNLSQPWWKAVPYVNLGVECNLTLPNGNIIYESNALPQTSIVLNRNNIKPFDVGIWAGVGLDYHFQLFYYDFLLAIEAGADLGLLNNFARTEQLGVVYANNSDMGNTSNLGTRKNRGIEVSVALGIPMYKRQKPKGGPMIDKYWPTIADTNDVPDDRQNAYDSLPRTDSVQKPTYIKSISEYEYKECYSPNEVLAMLEKGEKVCNLRICMYDINFEYDSYELTMGSKIKLEPVLQMLINHPEYNLQISGHTDSIGSDEYNDRLSRNRASEVVGFLMRKGIDGARLSSAGFGERYPIESNSTAAGRYRNRRVELELYCTGSD